MLFDQIYTSWCALGRYGGRTCLELPPICVPVPLLSQDIDSCLQTSQNTETAFATMYRGNLLTRRSCVAARESFSLKLSKATAWDRQFVIDLLRKTLLQSCVDGDQMTN